MEQAIPFSNFPSTMPTDPLPILSFDHPSLRRQSPDVVFPRTDLPDLVESLRVTLEGARGCGIAAPMVGIELNLIYVDDTGVFASADEEERRALFPEGSGLCTEMVNARILSEEGPKERSAEANLCFPGLSMEIERPRSIEVEYQILSGETIRRRIEGFDARVIQHELDHVNGILFTDRLSPAKRSMIAGKLRRIAAGETRPDYPMKYLKAHG
jgi:peptide deformylase